MNSRRMSSIKHRSSVRRRRRISDYQSMPTSSIEERLLQQAIEKSKVDAYRPDISESVPCGPTFFPTVEEFEGNPLHYINKIRPIAEKYGICKIVPPEGWNPPFCVDVNSSKKFQTKEQLLNRLQEGIAFGDGEEYNPKEYIKIAVERAEEWQQKHYPHHKVPSRQTNDLTNSMKNKMEAQSVEKGKKMTPASLESDYWNLVETLEDEVEVEYGNDIDTTEYWSGFPISERGRCLQSTKDKSKCKLPEPKFGTEDFYKETWWNLNNIPCCPDSILRHVKVGINGINVPWLYFGSLF